MSMNLDRKERDFLSGTHAPEMIRDFMADVGDDDIGLRIKAYEKIAALARAEAEAIIQIRMVEALREGETSLKSARVHLRRAVGSATAASAMVVNAN